MGVRGGSTIIMVAIGFMLFVLLPCDLVDAERYLIGGDINGWNFNISKWRMATEFTFKPRDEVVFTYPFGKHNVVPVNGVEYDYCGHAIDSKVYRSGNDTIKLKSGSNYFICDFPNHCESGMKLRLFAA